MSHIVWLLIGIASVGVAGYLVVDRLRHLRGR
jgi:hypothetical protein